MEPITHRENGNEGDHGNADRRDTTMEENNSKAKDTNGNSWAAPSFASNRRDVGKGVQMDDGALDDFDEDDLLEDEVMEQSPAVSPKYAVLSAVLDAGLGEQAKQPSGQHDCEMQEGCNSKPGLVELSKVPRDDCSKMKEATATLGHQLKCDGQQSDASFSSEVALPVIPKPVKVLNKISAALPKRRSKRREAEVDEDMLERAKRVVAKKNLDGPEGNSFKNSVLSFTDELVINNLRSLGISLGASENSVQDSVDHLKILEKERIKESTVKIGQDNHVELGESDVEDDDLYTLGDLSGDLSEEIMEYLTDSNRLLSNFKKVKSKKGKKHCVNSKVKTKISNK